MNRVDPRQLILMLPLAATVWLSCNNVGEDRVLAVESGGDVVGVVYFDRDGSGDLAAEDQLLASVRIDLVAQGGQSVGSAVSRTDGTFRIAGVPIGSYDVIVDTTSIADTLSVVRIDSATVRIARNDTARVEVIVGFPPLTVAEARGAGAGQRVFMEGIALHRAGVFGDTSLHFRDQTGSMRATSLQGLAVAAGDSVRLLGVLAVRSGAVVLSRASPRVLGTTSPPPAERVTAVAAATPDTTRLEAALVEIRAVTITDTISAGDDFVISVQDGTGALDIVLDGDLSFQIVSLVPQAVLNVVGVIQPTDSGDRVLKPRSPADVAITVSFLPISTARAQPVGTEVIVTGVAANGSATFGDSTVSLIDQSGAVRLTAVVGPIAAGDSATIRGVVNQRNGRPVIRVDQVTGEGTGTIPDPAPVSTSQASSAANGSLDAGIVEITGAVITDTSTAGSDFEVTVTDGSGVLTMSVDGSAAIDASELVPGAELDATGVLVPVNSSRWSLKPRSDSDIEITVPFLSIAEARGQAPGTRVATAGIALNAITAFGDQTVHISDATGAIRAAISGAATVFAGDSIRLSGTINTSNGQPVLAGATVTNLETAAVPPAVAVTTQQSSTASGGSLDAALVQIDSAMIEARTVQGADILLTVDDGSGEALLLLDGSAGIPSSELLPGAVIQATGLLVPTALSEWELKPRSAADVVVQIPFLSIIDARQAQVGDVVVVAGTVLNRWQAFGDSTLHISSTQSGTPRSIKAIRSDSIFVVPGDSVRLRGTVSVFNGQPALEGVTPFFVSIGGVAPSATVSTLDASSARGGLLDAGLAVVVGTTVSDTATVTGGFEVTVDDGSGPLVVLLDSDISFNTGGIVPGASVDWMGILEPMGGGTWRLKPRSQSDITVN